MNKRQRPSRTSQLVDESRHIIPLTVARGDNDCDKSAGNTKNGHRKKSRGGQKRIPAGALVRSFETFLGEFSQEGGWLFPGRRSTKTWNSVICRPAGEARTCSGGFVQPTGEVVRSRRGRALCVSDLDFMKAGRGQRQR